MSLPKEELKKSSKFNSSITQIPLTCESIKNKRTEKLKILNENYFNCIPKSYETIQKNV